MESEMQKAFQKCHEAQLKTKRETAGQQSLACDQRLGAVYSIIILRQKLCISPAQIDSHLVGIASETMDIVKEQDHYRLQIPMDLDLNHYSITPACIGKQFGLFES